MSTALDKALQRSTMAAARSASSSAPSSLGCSGGHIEVVVRTTKAARTAGTFG